MKLSLIFRVAAAAVSVSALPGIELTPRTSKYVCCTYLDIASDPIIQYYLEQYGISGVPNDAIVGLGCRKLMKGGTCSSSTQLGWCDLSSYVAPHIYTSCEMNVAQPDSS
ncbi:hypothetical protein BKA82DRAFT_1005570 [Pisolithus tinctorius]|uniref:Hydrophobin n=1 Tax=Pisolithus tinctorius Marx 270 TaxID=870435 RepID=A0A0C3JKV8_PISTI|nr:hypothetical protein BKA82DRAFT_1005570 [Pisolithus tinctorius]KIN98206.1 hypothetical protein M404DRAFT_1005570 [Pisolithus tinctorius Marx 270]